VVGVIPQRAESQTMVVKTGLCIITGRLPWQPAGIKFTLRQWPKISIFALVGKTMRWIEKLLAPVNDVLYHRAKFGGDQTTRACCIDVKIWCFLFVTLGLVPTRGGHSLNKYCVMV